MHHTPGPWIFGPNANLHADTSLQECLRVCNPRTNKTTALTWDESDARLIAAAPDLLAALQLVLAMPEYDGTQKTSITRRDAKRAARAAITKATRE